MSTQVFAVIPTKNVLSAERIVRACKELGVIISFPQGFSPSTDCGLIPCFLNGLAAPFEFVREEPVHADSFSLLSFEARASYASFAACAYVAASTALLGGGSLRDEDGEELRDKALADWLASIDAPTEETGEADLRISATVA